MDWHCWTCGEITKTAVDTDRPRCCRGASFTPSLPVQEPSTRQPRPDVTGDHEDVVLYMLVHHGGRIGLRTGNHPEIPTIITWIPSDGLAFPAYGRANQLEARAAQLRQARRRT